MSFEKTILPRINLRVDVRLKFEPPKSALARWDRSVLAKAAPAKETVIELFDVIGESFGGAGVTAAKIAETLKASAKKPITVQINSPGGDLVEGVAIYNLLRAHPAKVTVRVVGMAASAASLVAMAGDEIEMDETSWQMIHSAWGLAMGDSGEIAEFAALLETYDRAIADLYATRTGRSVADIVKMMKAETWMDAKRAFDERFADRIVPNEPREGDRPAARASRPDSVSLAALTATGHLARGGAVMAATKLGVASKKAVSLKGDEMKQTIPQQIAAFEAKRAASVARITEIMNSAGEAGRSLEAAEAEEHDNLKTEVAQVDEHLVRLREHERLVAVSAVPAAGDDPNAASAARGGAVVRSGSIQVRSNAPKGSGFTRYVIALAASKGNRYEAAQLAKHRWPDMPEVGRALMAAVSEGTTTDSAWAAPLVVTDNLASEFIDLLRPETIVGRITGFRRVPFNVKMPRKTSGSTVGWVGQHLPKPVSELAFDSVTLGFSKIAGIVVLTEELVRFSSPSAEAVVRQDLVETISQFQDQQFIDPTVAVVVNVSPASPLNGTTPVTSTGATVAAVDEDVKDLLAKFVAANIPLNRGVFVMNPRTALSLSLLRTTQDLRAYPDITPQGGTFFGLPVITSANVPIAVTSGNPTIIALIAPGEILFADDGGVNIDVSREASLQMDSAPTSGAQSLVSLWQNNLVGLKAERFVNYLKRRAAAAAYISGVTY